MALGGPNGIFSIPVRRLPRRWSQGLLSTAWQKDETQKDNPGYMGAKSEQVTISAMPS